MYRNFKNNLVEKLPIKILPSKLPVPIFLKKKLFLINIRNNVITQIKFIQKFDFYETLAKLG